MPILSGRFRANAPVRALVAAVLMLECAAAGAQATKKAQASVRRESPASPASQLEGAWKMVKSRNPATGQLLDIPGEIEITKLITGGRYAWIAARNGQAVGGMGGTCAVTANGYTETVTYALGQNDKALVGTSQKFTWTIEDGVWHHKGTLRLGNRTQEIDEYWERVR
ncbi:hypothetical protein OJF2_11180 [Aquisphaera giovannonii]|uniref:DUF4488 domain-containing protein n=1 Tax=Aquisphaera giovannonii TaxID=406548 RepID=A0A5B9VX01_9BACT|nr:hypothetical protein [Aquisphaera giovannonii]QEH32639.1 hypothetical protein OJF2_11180 [Aquisphaera giovannonii]